MNYKINLLLVSLSLTIYGNVFASEAEYVYQAINQRYASARIPSVGEIKAKTYTGVCVQYSSRGTYSFEDQFLAFRVEDHYGERRVKFVHGQLSYRDDSYLVGNAFYYSRWAKYEGDSLVGGMPWHPFYTSRLELRMGEDRYYYMKGVVDSEGEISQLNCFFPSAEIPADIKLNLISSQKQSRDQLTFTYTNPETLSLSGAVSCSERQSVLTLGDHKISLAPQCCWFLMAALETRIKGETVRDLKKEGFILSVDRESLDFMRLYKHGNLVPYADRSICR